MIGQRSQDGRRDRVATYSVRGAVCTLPSSEAVMAAKERHLVYNMVVITASITVFLTSGRLVLARLRVDVITKMPYNDGPGQSNKGDNATTCKSATNCAYCFKSQLSGPSGIRSHLYSLTPAHQRCNLPWRLLLPCIVTPFLTSIISVIRALTALDDALVTLIRGTKVQ